MIMARNERGHPLATLLLLGIGMLTAAILAARPAAADYREKVLHHFCHASYGTALCVKTGEYPDGGGVIRDRVGNLYGTTFAGGADNAGMVFELTPNAAGTAWTETVLHSFCSQARCADGAYPDPGLIMDGAGNLYGTTSNVSATVFELTPNAAKTAWTETVLYNCCASSGGLIMDSAGNLYGTTSDGGSRGLGSVFELTPNATRTAWTETDLYSFCSQILGCADGAHPNGDLVMDGAGNLYGTTFYGGANGGPFGEGGGTVFELMPNATRTAWTQTVLYSFCSQTRCTDGDGPTAGLTIDAQGNLYGTTVGGGFGVGDFQSGFGAVFELAPNGTRTAWRETVLYRFCRRDGCVDGSNPLAGLIMDTAGNLYGTAGGGGVSGSGVAFVLTPDRTEPGGRAETVLHQFCPQGRTVCPGGADPAAGLTLDRAGNLYGTTGSGGIARGGVVFELETAP